MADESKPTLQYQVAPPPVTRGQFRLLLLLMLIEVVVTVQATYAPGFVVWVKNAWAAHQQAVAARAALQKKLSVDQAAMGYTAPSTQVVWEEDPQRAAKLLASTGYQSIPLSNGGEPAFFSDAIPPTAYWVPAIPFPECIPLSPAETIVFMHERHASSQPVRLVGVFISGTLMGYQSSGNHPPDEAFDAAVKKGRMLVARSYPPNGEGGALIQELPFGNTLYLQPDENGIEMAAHWTPAERPGNPGKLSIQYHDILRVFFGQVDPSDPSHFTIGYEFDGKPGVFDGWLKADGSVDLEPRQGKRVGTLWYPEAR